MSQSSLLRKAHLLKMGLSPIQSLMGQSHLLCKAHLLEMGLFLIWSLMGQSHLLCEAHLLETGLSLIQSLMGQSHLLRKAHLLSGDDSFSGLESLMLIALSCNPKLSVAGQQTAKYDALYPLLFVLLTVPSFVERFQ